MSAEARKKTKRGFCTPDELLDGYVPDIPVTAAAKLTRLMMKLIVLKRPAVFSYGFDRKSMKGKQVLILEQHASRDDPYYVSAGYPFVQPNAVMGLHNVLIPVMFRLLLADGVILKSLYEPDISAMRHILRLRKKGASFLLFPEGIQSMDGTTQPIHPAAARLIKKLAMDTVLCTSHGAYLCNPRFDTGKRKGRLEYDFGMLFTKEELAGMTEDEICDRLIDRFRYNDFAWNSEKQYSYKGSGPLAHAGEGSIQLDADRLRYKGTKNGEETELSFDIGRMPSAVLTRSMANEFYYDGVYHQFAIKGDRRHAVKILLAIEALHDADDPARRKARQDIRY